MAYGCTILFNIAIHNCYITRCDIPYCVALSALVLLAWTTPYLAPTGVQTLVPGKLFHAQQDSFVIRLGHGLLVIFSSQSSLLGPLRSLGKAYVLNHDIQQVVLKTWGKHRDVSLSSGLDNSNGQLG